MSGAKFSYDKIDSYVDFLIIGFIRTAPLEWAVELRSNLCSVISLVSLTRGAQATFFGETRSHRHP